MPALNPYDKDRVRFHLGYASDGIPDGDALRLEFAMETMRSNTQIAYIISILDALDSDFQIFMFNADYDSKQLIAGDINRSTVTQTPNDTRQWQERYYKKCDILAQQLNVAGFHRPEDARYRFLRLGSTSLFPQFGIPYGLPDTSLADKLLVPLSYA